MQSEVRVGVGDCLHIRSDYCKRRQCGGTDGETLADRRRGVAQFVQRIGDGAGLGAETPHLRDATGVIRHRTIGIDRHCETDSCQHPDRGNADAIQSGHVGGNVNDAADRQYGNRHGLHANCETRDQHRCRTCFASRGNASDRRRRRVVLGHEPDDDAADRTGDHSPPDGDIQTALLDHEVGHGDEQQRRADCATAQRKRRLLSRQRADHGYAGQGADQSGRSQDQRQSHESGAGSTFLQARGEACEVNHTDRGSDRDRRDHRSAVAFEDIRAHAGNVADIVADVVCDHTRIAWVVFGDAGFELTHEVGTDIRAFGEDAAADAREERNGRCAHAKPVNVMCSDGITAIEVVEKSQAKEAHRCHGQPHDRAAKERHGQRRGRAIIVRSRRRADIRLGGGVHANPARNCGRQGTHQK